MWRALVLFDALTVAAYVYRERGETAAWVAVAVMAAVLLPLGAIERRLAEILKEMQRAGRGGACEIIGPVSQAQKIQEGQ